LDRPGGDTLSCGSDIGGPVCRTLSYGINSITTGKYYKIVNNIDISTGSFTVGIINIINK
jgi:hypothetical protein